MISKSLVLIALTSILVASCSFNDFNSYPYSSKPELKETQTEVSPTKE